MQDNEVGKIAYFARRKRIGAIRWVNEWGSVLGVCVCVCAREEALMQLFGVLVARTVAY